MNNIKVVTSEAVVTSESNGLVYVQREMVDFKFDTSNDTYFITVIDRKFKIENSERVFVENSLNKTWQYTHAEVDNLYQLVGSDITKSTGFTNGLKATLLSSLNAETIAFERYTTTNWVIDTE